MSVGLAGVGEICSNKVGKAAPSYYISQRGEEEDNRRSEV